MPTWIWLGLVVLALGVVAWWGWRFRFIEEERKLLDQLDDLWKHPPGKL